MRSAMPPVAFFLLSLVSCRPGSDKGNISSQSAGSTASTYQAPSNRISPSDSSCNISSTPALSIGQENGIDTTTLDRVTDATWLANGGIAVVQKLNGTIFVFDSSGRLTETRGRSGQGPSEIRTPWRVWPGRSDTIVVADARPWRFQFFPADNKQARAVRFTPEIVNRPEFSELLDNGQFLQAELCCRSESQTGVAESKLLVRLFDAGGAISDTIAILAYGRQMKLSPDRNASWMRPLFSSASSVASNGALIVLGEADHDEVRVLTAAGREIRRVRWSLEGKESSRSVSRDEIERYRKTRLAQSTPAIRQFVEEDISPNRPVSDAFPAFSQLLLGTDGILWVKLYRRPSAKADVFLRFDSTGTFLCRVNIPKNLEILRTRKDEILALERSDESGERVGVFQVR